MKDILTAPFVEEMKKTTANMYRLGWDERNGGNISYMLDESEVKEYLDTEKIIRTIPLDFDAAPLIGKIFIVTGTGKYFKNVESDPENNLGIIRIATDGTTAELLWGYKDGGKFTSELPAHLMSHMARLKVDPENRVIMHSHPTNTLAMNYVHELDEKKFTHTLWEMCTECIVVFLTAWAYCRGCFAEQTKSAEPRRKRWKNSVLLSGVCTAFTVQAKQWTKPSGLLKRWKRRHRFICLLLTCRELIP